MHPMFHNGKINLTAAVTVTRKRDDCWDLLLT